MYIFKPIKLKKKHIVWFTYEYGGMMVNTYKSTQMWNGKTIIGEKHEAMTQPLWYFPYSLQIIKCHKSNLAIGVCGKMIKDLYHLQIWKKDKIILTLRFFKVGFILHRFTKYKIDKKRKGCPHES